MVVGPKGVNLLIVDILPEIGADVLHDFQFILESLMIFEETFNQALTHLIAHTF